MRTTAPSSANQRKIMSRVRTRLSDFEGSTDTPIGQPLYRLRGCQNVHGAKVPPVKQVRDVRVQENYS
jgi:hypothetical protein